MQALGQVQPGFGEGSEGSGEGLGGFDAASQVQHGSRGFGGELGHVQQGSKQGSRLSRS